MTTERSGPPSAEEPGRTILYVFPHPDDECFGPAPAIAKQRREGNQVHLLTLTRGGATRQRHALGLSVHEMGQVRLREMEQVAEVLDLSGMTVLDFPDSGLEEMDPRILEEAVIEHVDRLSPHVIVTYPVHGISGFHDHLVTHAVVKRAFCELRHRAPGDAPRRLAFFTLEETEDREPGRIALRTSASHRIDCTIPVTEADMSVARAALDCYATYREIIEEMDPLGRVGRRLHFELFGEEHRPRLDSLTARLEGSTDPP